MAIGIVQLIIYVYILIALCLLGYSLFFEAKGRWEEKLHRKDSLFWETALRQQWKGMSKEHPLSIREIKEHRVLLEKKLQNINQLIGFHQAYERSYKDYESAVTKEYMAHYITSFQLLALQYEKRENMEKAYFAYVFTTCWQEGDTPYLPIMEIFNRYLIGSSVYCRENVLQALYKLGNVQAIESALHTINGYQYFHHSKLIADGLGTFNGDKVLLAQTLWAHRSQWQEDLLVAILQFMTRTTDQFVEPLWEVVQHERLSLEVHLAIIRYYKRHYYQPVEELLQGYVREGKDQNSTEAIVAITALENYPSAKTMEVLKEALAYSNWYMRQNAAMALITLGVTDADIAEIMNGKDAYAKEMFAYINRSRNKGNQGKPKEVTA